MAKQDAEKRERPKKPARAKRPKIYGLADPATGEIKYIGKAVDPCARYKGHIRDSARRNTPVYQWINGLGAMPELIVLASCITDDWQSVERQIIAQYRASGNILNVADGGNGPKSDPATNSLNAKLLNYRMSIDPRLKRIQEIKRFISNFLRDSSKGKVNPEIDQRVRSKLRLAAQKAPHIFGQYKNI